MDAQKPADGVGPLYHRRYIVRLSASEDACLNAMAKFKADINAFSPQLIAKFKKTVGEASVLASGDEYEVQLMMPLDAPVRVKEVHANSFKLETLENHIEAGEITFSLDMNSGQATFMIESFARSRDSIIDFLYDKVPVARKAQELMWTSMCASFARACTGESKAPDVTVLTEKRNAAGEWETV